MIKRPGKKLAEGLENVLYVCPKCKSVNTLITKGNSISCSHCKTEGYMDEYGFINGFKFDNPIDWDQWQKKEKELLYKAVVDTTGRLFTIRFKDDSEEFLGNISLHYENGEMKIEGDKNFTMNIKDMINPILLLRRDFSFTYQDVYYYIKLDKFGASLLRIAQDKY